MPKLGRSPIQHSITVVKMLRRCIASSCQLLEPASGVWPTSWTQGQFSRRLASQSGQGSSQDEQPDEIRSQEGQPGTNQKVNSDQAGPQASPTSPAQQEAMAASVARSLMSHFDTSDTPEAQPSSSAPQASSPRPGSRGPPVDTPLVPSGEPEPLSLDVLQVVLRAVENCKPSFKVLQSKSGNRVTYVPRIVATKEQTSLSIRWILNAANRRKESISGGRRPSMAECLATELLLAAQKEGSARQRRDEMHKLAVENRNSIIRRQ